MRAKAAKQWIKKGSTAMAQPKPPRERLREIRERTGVSGSQLQRDLGYSSPTGYLRYEQTPQGNNPIPYALIKRLIPLLRGRGNPPVTAEELLELSDAKSLPKPISKAFVSLVDDGDGLLSVRYRVEVGIFVRADSVRSFGASRIGVSKMYPAAEQFVAVVVEDIGEFVTGGTQLHCVSADQVPPAAMQKKRVVVGVRHGDLMEVAVGCVSTDQKIYDLEGLPLEGDILGVVVGAYIPE